MALGVQHRQRHSTARESQIGIVIYHRNVVLAAPDRFKDFCGAERWTADLRRLAQPFANDYQAAMRTPFLAERTYANLASNQHRPSFSGQREGAMADKCNGRYQETISRTATAVWSVPVSYRNPRPQTSRPTEGVCDVALCSFTSTGKL